MEDLATARISVAQIAQRIRHAAKDTSTGQAHDFELVKRLLKEELEDILRILKEEVKNQPVQAAAEERYRKALNISFRWIKNYTELDYRSLGSYTRRIRPHSGAARRLLAIGILKPGSELEEPMPNRGLSRREFFATAGGAFAAAMAAVPQVVKALPAAATSLGKVKIRDVKTAQIMARYPFNLVKIETDSGLFGIGEAFARQGIMEHIGGMKPLLVGQDPLLVETHWSRMMESGSGIATAPDH